MSRLRSTCQTAFSTDAPTALDMTDRVFDRCPGCARHDIAELPDFYKSVRTTLWTPSILFNLFISLSKSSLSCTYRSI